MRQIEKQMNFALSNKGNWSKSNTEVEYNDSTNCSTVKLHGNSIATYDHELKAVKKTVAPKVTVTTFKSGKVVAKKITLKRPSTARLISPQKYLKDIQTRWAIHNYEIQELISDFVKGFEAVKPYHAQLVELVTK